MASNAVRFADVVEMIDRLPLEERESLVEVVRKRNAEDARKRIAASVRSARRERYVPGKARPASHQTN